MAVLEKEERKIESELDVIKLPKRALEILHKSGDTKRDVEEALGLRIVKFPNIKTILHEEE